MRVSVYALAAVLLSTAVVFAQDEIKPEQLKTMYDNALVQLKLAQERKNELATQNAKLTADIEALKKQAEADRNELLELRRHVAEDADRSFFLRAHRAAWENFIKGYPQLMARWKAYLEAAPLGGSRSDLSETVDSNWPLSAKG